MQLRRRPSAPKLPRAPLLPSRRQGVVVSMVTETWRRRRHHTRAQPPAMARAAQDGVSCMCSTVQQKGVVAGGGGGEGGRRRGEGSRARKTQAEDMINWANGTIVLLVIACAVTYRAVL